MCVRLCPRLLSLSNGLIVGRRTRAADMLVGVSVVLHRLLSCRCCTRTGT